MDLNSKRNSNNLSNSSYQTSGYATGSDDSKTMLTKTPSPSQIMESIGSYVPYNSTLNTHEGYQYDVLFVYDPIDYSYTEELLNIVSAQDLRTFDYTRDAPPGIPQRQSFQTALRLCRYTCIVVTRNFISNFWLQFKSDMAIQDMLDSIEKMYSVVVVVMDKAIQPRNMPLDLMTLSPIFRAERFFDNRIKLAFQSKPVIRSRPWVGEEIKEIQDAQFHQQMYNKGGINRQPQEHESVVKSKYLQSPSPGQIFFRNDDSPERKSSVTVNSTGSRIPIETGEIDDDVPFPTADYHAILSSNECTHSAGSFSNEDFDSVLSYGKSNSLDEASSGIAFSTGRNSNDLDQDSVLDSVSLEISREPISRLSEKLDERCQLSGDLPQVGCRKNSFVEQESLHNKNLPPSDVEKKEQTINSQTESNVKEKTEQNSEIILQNEHPQQNDNKVKKSARHNSPDTKEQSDAEKSTKKGIKSFTYKFKKTFSFSKST